LFENAYKRAEGNSSSDAPKSLSQRKAPDDWEELERILLSKSALGAGKGISGGLSNTVMSNHIRGSRKFLGAQLFGFEIKLKNAEEAKKEELTASKAATVVNSVEDSAGSNETVRTSETVNYLRKYKARGCPAEGRIVGEVGGLEQRTETVNPSSFVSRQSEILIHFRCYYK
jgi:hypothetical protein